MDGKEYKQFVFGLMNPNIIKMGQDQCLVYLSSKLLNEIGEFLEVIDSEEDTKLVDELGDVFWYLQNIATVMNIEFTYLTDYTLAQPKSFYPENNVIIEASKLAGLLLKKVYHGKPVPDQDIILAVNRVYTTFLNLLTDLNDSLYESVDTFTLQNVMKYNFEKLSKRHGQSYNAGFYKTV